jgi:hypothetical protein
MLVWYGESYMQELGIDVENYFKRKPRVTQLKGLGELM